MNSAHPRPSFHPVLSAGYYPFDVANTDIEFRASHLFGLGTVTGSFTLLDGHAQIGEEPTAFTARARIDATSFSTGNSRRDRDVRGPRFLHTDRFPVIEVRLQHLESAAASPMWATGLLQAHGESTAIRVDIEDIQRIGRVIRARLNARVDRYALGITAARGMAGRHLEMSVSVVATAT